MFSPDFPVPGSSSQGTSAFHVSGPFHCGSRTPPMLVHAAHQNQSRFLKAVPPL
ncbi:hypothetical protein LEMLEM_LOCUS24333, partial [Lemmus lemmus]